MRSGECWLLIPSLIIKSNVGTVGTVGTWTKAVPSNHFTHLDSSCFIKKCTIYTISSTWNPWNGLSLDWLIPLGYAHHRSLQASWIPCSQQLLVTRPGKRLRLTMENHHAKNGKTHFKLPDSSDSSPKFRHFIGLRFWWTHLGCCWPLNPYPGGKKNAKTQASGRIGRFSWGSHQLWMVVSGQ